MAGGKSGEISISGSLPKAATGTINLCKDEGTTIGSTQVNNSASFAFSGLKNLKAGDKVQAQFVAEPKRNGVPSILSIVGDCSKLASSSGTPPTLTVSPSTANSMTYSGTVKGAKDGSVRICVNNVPKETAPATVDKNGNFNGGTATVPVNAGDSVTALSINPGATPSYGGQSQKVNIVAQPAASDAPNKPVSVVIGGVEYSGYSAQSQTTNGFLNIYYQGLKTNGFFGWTRIRLTSSPQQATNGVVSVISNPTGLTTQDYANVGQALDYVFGPAWNFKPNWTLIAGFGATTPLSSQNSTLTFVAPGPGTSAPN
ncbi:MAG: hypothetical protein ACLPHP_03490 [Candidatus Sulfotelmatobacter sp.]